MHDALGHEVADAFVDDGHVGVHQIPDGLHLPLQLRIHGEVLRRARTLTLHLRERDHRVRKLSREGGGWGWGGVHFTIPTSCKTLLSCTVYRNNMYETNATKANNNKICFLINNFINQEPTLISAL